MQQHDLSSTEDNDGKEYDFGRPVREVFGALQSLTGQNFGEQQLYHIFINDDDFPSQIKSKQILFHQAAERWAEWWRLHGDGLTDDVAYHAIELPPLPDASEARSLASDAPLNSASGSSNWLLESVQRPGSRTVFYDLDTGRATPLPERWRDEPMTGETLQQVREWAAQDGYDMMGDEISGTDNQAAFVLRPLGLRTWELPKGRWKARFDRTSIASLQEEGRANDADVLLHFDVPVNQAAPDETATFFYITREGTPGILYVGIQVHDDSLKPGGVSTGDDELNPVDFRKGRRFGYQRLVAAD